jgi:hypothetical protein
MGLLVVAGPGLEPPYDLYEVTLLERRGFLSRQFPTNHPVKFARVVVPRQDGKGCGGLARRRASNLWIFSQGSRQMGFILVFM